ncbi:hypothetical protein GDO81_018059 [Engystomops pustulosus]|uniref:Uncharacterized protein n=1 Tax=Engystomops pustulosus TaxID=76066 RepID=A0AAV7ACL2_ENGPU|nr:hypothetical protein GDO81_018059 [Engystomops pustulosus]
MYEYFPAYMIYVGSTTGCGLQIRIHLVHSEMGVVWLPCHTFLCCLVWLLFWYLWLSNSAISCEASFTHNYSFMAAFLGW